LEDALLFHNVRCIAAGFALAAFAVNIGITANSAYAERRKANQYNNRCSDWDGCRHQYGGIIQKSGTALITSIAAVICRTVTPATTIPTTRLVCHTRSSSTFLTGIPDRVVPNGPNHRIFAVMKNPGCSIRQWAFTILTPFPRNNAGEFSYTLKTRHGSGLFQNRHVIKPDRNAS